ncbi:hypothetical protein CLF_105839 [Clonorchis sinensis]|uniref:Uncharacterized protein n=1 Tax=Clonorchis sinensis TaxID=79923 RepID=G7YPH1_CLOSI|nr:hypothetical protein CLF_105839 [Clonorchis sinensis]
MLGHGDYFYGLCVFLLTFGCLFDNSSAYLDRQDLSKRFGAALFEPDLPWLLENRNERLESDTDYSDTPWTPNFAYDSVEDPLYTALFLAAQAVSLSKKAPILKHDDGINEAGINVSAVNIVPDQRQRVLSKMLPSEQRGGDHQRATIEQEPIQFGGLEQYQLHRNEQHRLPNHPSLRIRSEEIRLLPLLAELERSMELRSRRELDLTRRTLNGEAVPYGFSDEHIDPKIETIPRRVRRDDNPAVSSTPKGLRSYLVWKLVDGCESNVDKLNRGIWTGKMTRCLECEFTDRKALITWQYLSPPSGGMAAGHQKIVTTGRYVNPSQTGLFNIGLEHPILADDRWLDLTRE